MATAQQSSSTETLFHQWRKGDAASGQAMAQRFTDWYFAIAATRLGEGDGDAAFREACTTFSRGVGKVTDARRLLGWAHNIARKQIQGSIPQGRRADGDLPNAFTRNASPKELLVRVRDHLPHEMYLLETAYRGQPISDPQDLLVARYAVKGFLKATWEVPFRVTPRDPDPDRAPIAFYEAGTMADENEETHFELYMLHDMDVCQDVAEFAHYAIALRGRLPGETPRPQPKAQAAKRAPATVQPAAAPAAHEPVAQAAELGPVHNVASPAPAPARSTGGTPSVQTMAVVMGGIAIVLVLALLVALYVAG